jgi:hypothetical protein
MRLSVGLGLVMAMACGVVFAAEEKKIPKAVQEDLEWWTGEWTLKLEPEGQLPTELILTSELGKGKHCRVSQAKEFTAVTGWTGQRDKLSW